MSATPTPEQVLATPMPPNEAGAQTVRDYLLSLLTLLWSDREGFDAKKPFGNSNWDNDLYVALVAAGYITAELDEGGIAHIQDADDELGTTLIAQGIKALKPADA